MKCTACGNVLKEKVVSDITVDVCEGGCGGIWFDRFELQKVDEPQEAAGESLLEIEKDESIVIDHEKRRPCPKCGDVIMMRHFYSVKTDVEVDECPKCAGFWLDFGELGKIRTQFETEEDKQKAAEKYFSHMFDGELKTMRMESEEQASKVRNIARMFRFICPSFYIPGKQKWGAF